MNFLEVKPLEVFNLLFYSKLIVRNDKGYTILLNKPKDDIIAFREFRKDIEERKKRLLNDKFESTKGGLDKVNTWGE